MSQHPVYYLLTAVSGLLFTFAFTLLLVFHVQVAHLSPVQLVLAGTVMEITCFLGEVPTGVLADVRSRTLSVQLGLILIGLSLLLQGFFPVLGWILAAQVVRGIVQVAGMAGFGTAGAGRVDPRTSAGSLAGP